MGSLGRAIERVQEDLPEPQLKAETLLPLTFGPSTVGSYPDVPLSTMQVYAEARRMNTKPCKNIR